MKKGTCQEIVPMEAVAGEAVAPDPVPRLPMMIGEHLPPPAAAVHGLRVLMQLLEAEQHRVLENQMMMTGELQHLLEEAVDQHQVPASQMTMIGELLRLP